MAVSDEVAPHDCNSRLRYPASTYLLLKDYPVALQRSQDRNLRTAADVEELDIESATASRLTAGAARNKVNVRRIIGEAGNLRRKG